MEKLALISSKSPVFFAPPKPSNHFNRLQRPFHPPVGLRGSRFISCALKRGGSSPRISNNASKTIERHDFACISSSTSSNSEMYTSGNQQIPFPPPSSSIGSPLFWVGVGVGLSALFSIVAKKLKEYAMQQAFKTMMSQAAPQNDQFSNLAFSPGSPFPFNATPSPASQMASSAKPLAASRPVDTVDVAATKVETTSLNEVKDETATKELKKYAFVDVSPDEVLQKDSRYSEGPVEVHSAEEIRSEKEVSPNGASVRQENNTSREQSRSSRSSAVSVEALEKMMEDPTVQKMVYPYLPEEMRNPTTFKWMLQNPEYRRQLEDMLTNMGGSSEWDSRMVESLKNFDLSSPDVKQQFEQIGLTPEEVISRIMANPEVALAFQNPKVQAAMMDVSQNPLSIAKYQNDKEVMDAFNKISELFPGATGSP